MKKNNSSASNFGISRLVPLLLLGVLALFFWRSFDPDFVHFSNDGPLGQQNGAWLKLPGAFTGMWFDLNDVGFSSGSYPLSVSALIKFVLGPVGYAKFYAPVALFILGLGAWTFFRALKLSPLAALLGAFAAALGSTFLSTACWGVAGGEIAVGFNFMALALVLASSAETPRLVRWTRLALAGFCVGINVIEAADIGALCSLLVALFVFYKSLVEAEGGLVRKISRGIGRVAVIAIFAGLLATQTVVSLVTTQIQGVAGTAQDAESKAANWDKATQWSLPKMETLGLFVPGLFGYKMDTPNNMMPQFQPWYEGGVYWGGMGRSPEIDRFFDSGATGTPPAGMMRFSGGGNYGGILVCLLAAWAVAQSFRKKDSPFADTQKKIIWFWAAILVVSLPLAWGRFAPMFYGLLYQLPYFSTIRNPAKFGIFVSWALVILFAYGVHALSQRYLANAAGKSAAPVNQFKLANWWGRATSFDRKWVFACAALLGGSLLGWVIFASEKTSFISYLKKMGYPDDALASQIATFSIGQAGWFGLLLAAAMLLVTLIIAGYFSGPRAKIGGTLLGAFLLFDLGRADLPYIIHWDYKQKYEIGTLNPIVERLRDQPYEHRVAGLPFEPQQPLRSYDNAFGGSGIYRIEWTQHHFPYYNIQCLDWIQMPRLAEDLKTYLEALTPHATQESAPLLARRWQLSNTRYLLGAAGFLDVMNQQLDPAQHRFRIVQRFDIIAKPGIIHPTQLEELTATASPDGDLAVFDFTGALPRAKLYSNWQVNTNDAANLKTLADLNFDPAKTVLISTPQTDLPVVATNENSGTVEFISYAPKKIVFNANAPAPSVLLLNDKYDANWRVTVDGKPAGLLRCNYLMRGVYLPAGQHTVAFKFTQPNRPLYVTITAFGVAIFLSGLLVFLTRKTQTPATK
jgi:hypothetical protein